MNFYIMESAAESRKREKRRAEGPREEIEEPTCACSFAYHDGQKQRTYYTISLSRLEFDSSYELTNPKTRP